MIIRNNFKITLLIFGLLIRPSEAFYIGERFDYNIPQGREWSNFMPVQTKTPAGDRTALPDLLVSPATPLGIDAPYCKYNLIFNLAPAYIALDGYLSGVIDKAIGSFGADRLKDLLSPHYLGLADLRAALIFLFKSPYYKEGRLEIPQEALSGVQDRTRLLYSLTQELSSKITPAEREYIRNFDTSVVEPDIKPWPGYWRIEDAWEEVRQQGILEGKVNYRGVEAYKDEIERAVVSALAGFNYASDRSSLLSEQITSQAMTDFHSRLEYWLKTQEYIPSDLFIRVRDKARELFGSLQLKKGLFASSPWQGEIARIYRILGGEIPTQVEPGRLTRFSDWGEDIYKRLWDISSHIEKTDSDFGVLLKGPDMTIEQLKDRVRLIGPAIVGITKEERKEFVRILEIASDGRGESIVYQDAQRRLHSMDSVAEFLPAWDRFVYVIEEKSSYAYVVSDFDFNPGSFSLLKGYGQWTINEFDELKARIGINANIPLSSSLPYFYTQYQIGGEDTYRYSGYFQTGLWLTFDNGIKSQLLRGTALAFDAYVSDYPGLKYIRIELKEEETGKIIREFIIPREHLNLAGWNTFKIPIHYYLPGTLSLTLGVIGSYPAFYAPRDLFLAIDRICVE